jgi:Bacterial PH domain
MVGWLSSIVSPHVERHVLVDEGELIIDEVHHHWVVYLRANAEVLAGILAFVLFLFSPVREAWVPFLIAVGLFLHASWLALKEYRDRFVVTNMRVFRLNGVFNQRLATMPMARILDITVEKPFTGRMLGYGHFIFENAAQDQGLREIRYVGDPDGRDITIERAIIEAGLRPLERSVTRRAR